MSVMAYFIGGPDDMTKRVLHHADRRLEVAVREPFYAPPKSPDSRDRTLVMARMETYYLKGPVGVRERVYVYVWEGLLDGRA